MLDSICHRHENRFVIMWPLEKRQDFVMGKCDVVMCAIVERFSL